MKSSIRNKGLGWVASYSLQKNRVHHPAVVNDDVPQLDKFPCELPLLRILEELNPKAVREIVFDARYAFISQFIDPAFDEKFDYVCHTREVNDVLHLNGFVGCKYFWLLFNAFLHYLRKESLKCIDGVVRQIFRVCSRESFERLLSRLGIIVKVSVAKRLLGNTAALICMRNDLNQKHEGVERLPVGDESVGKRFTAEKASARDKILGRNFIVRLCQSRPTFWVTLLSLSQRRVGEWLRLPWLLPNPKMTWLVTASAPCHQMPV